MQKNLTQERFLSLKAAGLMGRNMQYWAIHLLLGIHIQKRWILPCRWLFFPQLIRRLLQLPAQINISILGQINSNQTVCFHSLKKRYQRRATLILFSLYSLILCTFRGLDSSLHKHPVLYHRCISSPWKWNKIILKIQASEQPGLLWFLYLKKCNQHMISKFYNIPERYYYVHYTNNTTTG